MGLALLAVVVAAAAAPPPPVIHEPFTPLPCPKHPVSTLDLEGCAERALLKSDRAIDARVRRIYAKLSAAGRADFVHGEQAWLRYRRASCSAETSVFAGGTIQPVAFARCETRRNTTHLAELAALERALRQR